MEGFDLETPKTSGYLDIIKKLNLLDKKTLLVLNESNKNIYLSSRNLRKAKVVSVYDLNTYDILNAQNVIISEPAASKFDEFLKINE